MDLILALMGVLHQIMHGLVLCIACSMDWFIASHLAWLGSLPCLLHVLVLWINPCNAGFMASSPESFMCWLFASNLAWVEVNLCISCCMHLFIVWKFPWWTHRMNFVYYLVLCTFLAFIGYLYQFLHLLVLCINPWTNKLFEPTMSMQGWIIASIFAMSIQFCNAGVFVLTLAWIGSLDYGLDLLINSCIDWIFAS
jgi:hypothetical protein